MTVILTALAMPLDGLSITRILKLLLSRSHATSQLIVGMYAVRGPWRTLYGNYTV